MGDGFWLFCAVNRQSCEDLHEPLIIAPSVAWIESFKFCRLCDSSEKALSSTDANRCSSFAIEVIDWVILENACETPHRAEVVGVSIYGCPHLSIWSVQV